MNNDAKNAAIFGGLLGVIAAVFIVIPLGCHWATSNIPDGDIEKFEYIERNGDSRIKLMAKEFKKDGRITNNELMRLRDDYLAQEKIKTGS